MTMPIAANAAMLPAPLGHHVTLALRGRRLLAAGSAERRLLARVVYEHLDGRGLVSFGAADDHLHVLLARDRLACGSLVRCLATALRKRLRLDVPFEPTHYEPIENPRHERNTYFYALRQDQHHGANADPFFDATSLPDRIGARVLLTRAREPLRRFTWLPGHASSPDARSISVARIDGSGLLDGGFRAPDGGSRVPDGGSRASDCGSRAPDSGRHVIARSETARAQRPRVTVLGAAASSLARRRLPRVHTGDVLALVGGDALHEAPLALDFLEDAAAAAVGLPHLGGIDPATVLARRGAVHLARRTMSHGALAELLRVTLRTIQRDATSPTSPRILRAVELQLRMRSLLGPTDEWPIDPR